MLKNLKKNHLAQQVAQFVNMKLFEFADDDPLRVKLTAVTSQLKQFQEQSDFPLSTDDFLKILRKHGISLDKSDLFDIVKKEPLKNVISDVNDQEVTFRGQESPEIEQGPDENEKVRSQMASKALK